MNEWERGKKRKQGYIMAAVTVVTAGQWRQKGHLWVYHAGRDKKMDITISTLGGKCRISTFVVYILVVSITCTA